MRSFRWCAFVESLLLPLGWKLWCHGNLNGCTPTSQFAEASQTMSIPTCNRILKRNVVIDCVCVIRMNILQALPYILGINMCWDHCRGTDIADNSYWQTDLHRINSQWNILLVWFCWRRLLQWYVYNMHKISVRKHSLVKIDRAFYRQRLKSDMTRVSAHVKSLSQRQ